MTGDALTKPSVYKRQRDDFVTGENRATVQKKPTGLKCISL